MRISTTLIQSSSLYNLSDNPVTLLPSLPNKLNIYNIDKIIWRYNYNTAPYSFDFPTIFQLTNNTDYFSDFLAINLNTSENQIFNFPDQYSISGSLLLSLSGSNPDSGDGDLFIDVYYDIVDVDAPIQNFIFSGSGVIVTGSLNISGSLTSTSGITGSLLGTSSYANNVLVKTTSSAGTHFIHFGNANSGYDDILVNNNITYEPDKSQLTTGVVVANSFIGTASFASTSSWANNYNETDPIFVAKSASLATTGSNIFKASQVITGSLTITNDLIVLGSSSITYISQSTLDIATNLITVNTITPSVRFGGLAVIDSGSSPQTSGSILFDSQNNQWIFVHQSTGGAITSSVFIQGPQTFNNVGNEATITANRLTKGTGGDLGEHIGDSNITDTGTVVSINSNTEITGSLRFLNGGVTSSLFGTASWAENYNETDPIFTSKSGSFTTTSSFNSFTSSYTTGSFTGSFTGELIGTASYATTASYALSSPGGGGISETLAIAYAIALG